MMMIFGSRRCDSCHFRYDWVGNLENRANEQMANLITRSISRFVFRNEDYQTSIVKSMFIQLLIPINQS
jgi:hypothetical protein